MTGREKFLEFINSNNNFRAKYGYSDIEEEFVSYDDEFDFGILKCTDTLSTGSVIVRYSLYSLYSSDVFTLLRHFKKLSSAEKAVKALTFID